MDSRRFLAASAALALAGCAALGLGPVTPPPASFDLQSLVGRWQGQWTRLDQRGRITLDITDIVDGKVSGRMTLEGFSAYERDQPLDGVVFARGGNVILSVTGAVPMSLTITGAVMWGTIPSSVPSTQATITLQRIF